MDNTTKKRGRALGKDTVERLNRAAFLQNMVSEGVFKISELPNIIGASYGAISIWIGNDDFRLDYLLLLCDFFGLTFTVNFEKSSDDLIERTSLSYKGDKARCEGYIREYSDNPSKALDASAMIDINKEGRTIFCRKVFYLFDAFQNIDIQKLLGCTYPRVKRLLPYSFTLSDIETACKSYGGKCSFDMTINE